MSDKAFAAAIERIEAKPTVEQPNPFDAFLSLVPARLATMFKGVAVQDVMAAPTMGNIAEDVIVGRMMKDEQ